MKKQILKEKQNQSNVGKYTRKTVIAIYRSFKLATKVTQGNKYLYDHRKNNYFNSYSLKKHLHSKERRSTDEGTKKTS